MNDTPEIDPLDALSALLDLQREQNQTLAAISNELTAQGQLMNRNRATAEEQARKIKNIYLAIQIIGLIILIGTVLFVLVVLL